MKCYIRIFLFLVVVRLSLSDQWKYSTNTNSSYYIKFGEPRMSFTQAEQHCQSMGARLSSLSKKDEHFPDWDSRNTGGRRLFGLGRNESTKPHSWYLQSGKQKLPINWEKPFEPSESFKQEDFAIIIGAPGKFWYFQYSDWKDMACNNTYVQHVCRRQGARSTWTKSDTSVHQDEASPSNKKDPQMLMIFDDNPCLTTVFRTTKPAIFIPEATTKKTEVLPTTELSSSLSKIPVLTWIAIALVLFSIFAILLLVIVICLLYKRPKPERPPTPPPPPTIPLPRSMPDNMYDRRKEEEIPLSWKRTHEPHEHIYEDILERRETTRLSPGASSYEVPDSGQNKLLNQKYLGRNNHYEQQPMYKPLTG